MRKKGYIVRTLLILMIILSMVLTIKLGIDAGNQPKNHHPQSTLTDNRSAEDLLLPTAFYEHRQNKVYEETKESQLSKIMSKLKEMDVSVEHHKEKWNLDKIKKAQSFSEGLELAYASVISLHDFQEIYNFKGKLTIPDMMFNHIFINFETKEIVFVNSVQKEAWVLSVNQSLTPLKELMTTQGVEMEHVDQNSLSYVPIHEQKMPKYSYILSQQPYTVFTQSFFKNPTSVETTGDDIHTIFKGDQSEEMRVNNKNGVLSLMINDDGDKKSSELLLSLEVVSRLGQDFGNLRYFDHQNGHYEFYAFVEGYPIFADDYRGRVSISFLNQQFRLMTNQSVIQIPIPDNRVVTLKSGRDVVKQLHRHHLNFKRIHRIQIGYTWQETKTDTQAVTLVPTWLVYYDKEWYTLDQLLKK